MWNLWAWYFGLRFFSYYAEFFYDQRASERKSQVLQKEHENAKLPLLPSLKKWPSAIAENTVQNLFQVSHRWQLTVEWLLLSMKNVTISLQHTFHQFPIIYLNQLARNPKYLVGNWSKYLSILLWYNFLYLWLISLKIC